MRYDKYINIVSRRLKPSRLKHTLGVMTTARELAKIYGCSDEKVTISAILHDYAKNLKDDELEAFIIENGIDIDQEIKDNIQLAHGFVGAELVKKDLGIDDEDILNAIRYHTFGREDMSLLEKIIFLADSIEESRDYPGVDEIRVLSKKDLNKALIKCIESTLKYVLDKGDIIHLNSVKVRNSILKEKKSNKNQNNE